MPAGVSAATPLAPAAMPAQPAADKGGAGLAGFATQLATARDQQAAAGAPSVLSTPGVVPGAAALSPPSLSPPSSEAVPVAGAALTPAVAGLAPALPPTDAVVPAEPPAAPQPAMDPTANDIAMAALIAQPHASPAVGKDQVEQSGRPRSSTGARRGATGQGEASSPPPGADSLMAIPISLVPDLLPPTSPPPPILDTLPDATDRKAGPAAARDPGGSPEASRAGAADTSAQPAGGPQAAAVASTPAEAGRHVAPEPPLPAAAAVSDASAAPASGFPSLTMPDYQAPSVSDGPARPPSDVPTPPPASPATQLAPALVSMGRTPGGGQSLVMRLDPPDLGQVHVRVDRLPDASARVEITVQRAETLTLLLRDQPQLERALDQAGVPVEGRTITFHVAQADAGGRPGDMPTFSSGGASSGQTGGDGSNAAYRQGGGQSRQDGSGFGEDAVSEYTPVPLPSWVRAGINITA